MLVAQVGVPMAKKLLLSQDQNYVQFHLKVALPTIFENTDCWKDLLIGHQIQRFFITNQGIEIFIFLILLHKENKLLVSNDSVGWMFNPRLSPDNLNLAVFWNRYLNK